MAPETIIRTAIGTEPLFLRACLKEQVERTPIWIMRQAGRYLPEYRAVRERYDFLTTCRTPDLASELTLQPVRRLGVDAAILFSDILIPLPGMGVDVQFSPSPSIATPVRTRADIERLRVPDPYESTPFVMDTIRQLRERLPRGVALIGFAGAPFTMATYLVEGGSSRSFLATKGLLWNDPSAARELVNRCADAVAAYLAAQIDAGAQAVMLFDTWAGILPPSDFEELAASPARRVFDGIVERRGEKSGAVPFIYYAGDAAGSLDRCRAIGADVVGVDWRVDLRAARRALGPSVAVQGNLDPTILMAPPSIIRQRAAGVLRDAAAGDTGPGTGRASASIGHIFNLGHGILPGTPPDHARVLVDAVHEFSSGATPC